ncbi:hypothetical protein Tco_0363724 [Tanacetum coccineum]
MSLSVCSLDNKALVLPMVWRLTTGEALESDQCENSISAQSKLTDRLENTQGSLDNHGCIIGPGSFLPPVLLLVIVVVSVAVVVVVIVVVMVIVVGVSLVVAGFEEVMFPLILLGNPRMYFSIFLLSVDTNSGHIRTSSWKRLLCWAVFSGHHSFHVAPGDLISISKSQSLNISVPPG